MKQENGRIRYVRHESAVLLRFEGDVRVTHCEPFEQLSGSLLKPETGQQMPTSLVVDVSAAINIDSTMLGMLARLAIGFSQAGQSTPVMICSSADMLQLMHSMALHQVFTIISQAPQWVSELAANMHTLGGNAGERGTENLGAVQSTVIDVHRLLMSLNDANQARFKSLVTQLEQSPDA